MFDHLPPGFRNITKPTRERSPHSISLKNSKSSKKSRPQPSRFIPDTSDNHSNFTEQDATNDKISMNKAIGDPYLTTILGFDKTNERFHNDRTILNQRDKIKDYEEILQDSPTNTQSLNMTEETTAYLESFDLGMENTSDLGRMLKEEAQKQQGKKGVHKRGISHTTMPKHIPKTPKLVHQSSLLMDKMDLDSVFTKYLNNQSNMKFNKIESIRINRHFSEQIQHKSSLSYGLKNEGTEKV